MRAAEVIAPEDTAEAAAQVLAAKLAKALGRGVAPPARIRTDAEDLASALQGRLPAGIFFRIAPTPEVDAAMHDLAEWSSERDAGPEPGYLEQGRIAPEAVHRFFEAASRLYRAAPWTRIENDSQVLRLEAPWAGFDDACVSVVGTLGTSRGFGVFESLRDFRAFARLSDDIHFSGERPRGPGVPMLSVHFDQAKELPAGMRDEVKAHRWPVVGAKAYPWLMHMDGDGVRRPLTESDYALAAGCAEALVEMFDRHAAIFSEPEPEPATVVRQLDRGEGPVELRLTAPCPGLDWDWAEETAIDAVRREEAAALVSEHMDAVRASGAPDEDLDESQALIEHLMRFKLEVADEPPLGWAADQVEGFLLDYFPAGVIAEGPAVERTPALLNGFFAWLGANDLADAEDVSEIRERIAQVRAEFEKRALDRSNFGVAKTLMMEMHRAGVDPTDTEAVGRFMARFNERSDLARGAASKVRVRWTPRPGQAPPGPAEACPCGSGRRYKKCCMRR